MKLSVRFSPGDYLIALGGVGQGGVASVTRGGIQERTVGLRFLGIILRVLRLEVSTLVLCLSTRCSS
jgi:hypothetical protein